MITPMQGAVMPERFYLDPYQTTLETTVIRHDDAGLVLADTLCYPLGGGQPGDTATLTLADGSTLAISDTRRNRETREISTSPLPMPRDWPQAARHPDAGLGRHRPHAGAYRPAFAVGGDQGRGHRRQSDRRRRAAGFDLPEGMELDKDEIEAGLNALVAQTWR
jgi:misacylated tRNA(Ala) deacylase